MSHSTLSTNGATTSASSFHNEIEDVSSFVEYVPPPATKIQPPAKYKLWLIVMVLVYFAEWFALEAGVLERFNASGWLSPNASLFLMLAIIVFVLVFSTLDLVVALLTVRIGDRPYGLGPWLKQPRVQWVHESENFFIECIACVVTIFEDGFSIFDGPEDSSKPHDPSGGEGKEYECGSDCQTVLRVEHRVDPTKMREYEKWLEKIGKVSNRWARGLKKVEKSPIGVESFDEEEGGADGIGKTTSSEGGQLQVVTLTFSHVDYLNEWMQSPKRKRLMKELEPMLMVPDIVKVQNARALPDAFTDLLTRQGEAVPPLLPKKWKVAWLTLISLFFTILWTGAVMPYYLAQWGLDNAHLRLQAFVSILITTFLNSYVMTPLTLFLFCNWVQRKECENDKREPWRTLNDGIQSIWLKALLTLALYGGFLIAWGAKGF